MLVLHIDLETRSRVSLEDCGVSKYARHESTEVLCAAWSVGEGPVNVWRPGDDPPEPLLDPDVVVSAHNASFEMYLCRHVLTPRHGWPVVPVSRWVCTAARAAHRNLPRGLGKLSDRLEFGDAAKSKAGRENMLKLCKPFGDRKKGGEKTRKVNGVILGGKFDDDPQRHADNEVYCQQDVVAEREVVRRVPPMPERLQRLWSLDHRINARGVPIDRALCDGAIELVRVARLRAGDRLSELTGGLVTAVTQRQRIQEFIAANGYPMKSIAEEPLNDALLDESMPPIVRKVLTIRADAASAAVAKFDRVRAIVDGDDRCREQFVFFGASTTGRWSGRGLQPQNMKRADAVPEDVLDMIRRSDFDAIVEAKADDVGESVDAALGAVIGTARMAVRSLICAPPGRTMVHSDFSAIEARMLAWLAGEESVLDTFRKGICIYSGMKAQMEGKGEDYARWVADNYETDPAAKAERQVGKAAVLGLGYQCGASNFVAMAKKLAGLTLTDTESASIVDLYRTSNPNIVQFWRDLQAAATYCVEKGKAVRVRRVKFYMAGEWLGLQLPSGRSLYYHQPRVVDGKFNTRQVAYTPAQGAKSKHLYGGMLAENITQAASADLLMDALLRLDRQWLPVVLHVHDSVSVECKEGDELTPRLVHEAMETVEPWADGFPIAAKTEVCRRMP